MERLFTKLCGDVNGQDPGEGGRPSARARNRLEKYERETRLAQPRAYQEPDHEVAALQFGLVSAAFRADVQWCRSCGQRNHQRVGLQPVWRPWMPAPVRKGELQHICPMYGYFHGHRNSGSISTRSTQLAARSQPVIGKPHPRPHQPAYPGPANATYTRGHALSGHLRTKFLQYDGPHGSPKDFAAWMAWVRCWQQLVQPLSVQRWLHLVSKAQVRHRWPDGGNGMLAHRVRYKDPS